MATLIKGKNKNKPNTVRYFFENRQRERSFRTAREARDFMAKFEHDSREHIFVDTRTTETFAEASERWLSMHLCAPKTKSTYGLVLRNYLVPELGSKRMGTIAMQREEAQRLVSVTLPEKYGLGASSIRISYLVLNAIVNDSIRAGRLQRSRIGGLDLPPLPRKKELLFPTREQVEKLAQEMPDGYGLSVYLMHGCGLRLGEMLGVRFEDFRNGVLRLQRQLGPDGKTYAPLKHRTSDDFRDIPCPDYVLSQVGDGHGQVFEAVNHNSYHRWFRKARAAAGLPSDFTPHTLRHVFASVALGAGIPITDVSKWLGHRSIQITYGIYGHLVPASWDRARAVLDEEWKS